MVHTNFGGNSYGPIISLFLFLGKIVWTNGPESSSKVYPYTGIGPWTALPSLGNKKCARTFLHRLLEHPRILPGHPGKIPVTSQIPLFENPRKTSLRVRARTFRPPPLRVEDPPPHPAVPRPKKKANSCALFSCLILLKRDEICEVTVLLTLQKSRKN